MSGPGRAAALANSIAGLKATFPSSSPIRDSLAVTWTIR